ncbi:MAG TPA: GTPase ObgE [Bacteroidales bacterium]|nr:GTPase ObgE [Bacteroidales bacterium]
MNSNFVDYIKIYCRSGKGGAGSVHFRREKYIAKGGPDGGNGGKGGDIIVVGNKNLWTLLHLRYTRHLYAEEGGNGSSACSTGADGLDSLLELPLGTICKDYNTGEILCEVTEHGERHVLLPGGRGGMGNEHFKTSTHQAPDYAQPGEPMEEKEILLELKILADVGLVGFPNAGKSTLLSVLSSAKPQIADYPFTTLVPNLGIVSYRDNLSFAMADIPGIIEGAHEGKGLGLRFLRHIERNAILLFLVPATSDNVLKEYEILLNELRQFNPELLDKDRLLAISKSDLLDQELEEMISAELVGIPHLFISSVAQKGLTKLKDEIWTLFTKND